MVRLRAAQFMSSSSSSSSSPTPPTKTSTSSAPVLLFFLRAHAAAGLLLVLVDAASSSPFPVYSRPLVEAVKALLFLLAVCLLPSTHPSLFLRLGVVWAFFLLGYGLLLPAVGLAKRSSSSSSSFSLWEKEWRHAGLVMGNSLVGVLLIGTWCVHTLGQGTRRRGGGDVNHKRRKKQM